MRKGGAEKFSISDRIFVKSMGLFLIGCRYDVLNSELWDVLVLLRLNVNMALTSIHVPARKLIHTIILHEN